MKFLFIATFLVLTACAKNSEITANDVQSPNQQNIAKKPGASSVEAEAPEATIDETQITVNRNDKIHLHVLLNKKFSEPITVNVNIVDSTARFERDYTGFATGNRKSQPAVFDAGTLVAHFPRILVTSHATCGGKFFVQLSAENGQKIALGPPTEVLINCP